jgi:tetratricopeptide (TPR) repeat protein
VWVREGTDEEAVRSRRDSRPKTASAAPGEPSGTTAQRSGPTDPEVLQEVTRAATDVRAARRDFLVARFEQAVTAYERGRFDETLRLLGPLVQDLPRLPAVRQLAGLAAYRSGHWRQAVRHLDLHHQLTDQLGDLPLLMDSYRALGRRRKVAEVWSSLRHRSPSADVLAEARIVAAASAADAGDLAGAISLLADAGASKSLRNPADRHIRQWYALADLYERAGDLLRATELFERVARAEPDAYDVASRLRALGGGRRRRRGGGNRRQKAAS